MAMNSCPACGEPIAMDDINIKEGVGLCQACGKLSRLAEIADQPEADAKALANPPEGCSYEEQIGGGMLVRASLRSMGAALGALVFCLFWNGIVSVFVLIAIAGLHRHFIGPLPAWFPAPGGNNGGDLAEEMPLGMTLFLCIFLIPFVTIGLGMFVAFLTCLMGRVEVVISMGTGRVRTGIGPFNWTRRFDASKVKRVVGGQTTYEQNGQRKPLIQIEAADRTVKFGSMLPDERRQWMLGMLHLLLVTQPKGARSALGLSALARN